MRICFNHSTTSKGIKATKMQWITERIKRNRTIIVIAFIFLKFMVDRKAGSWKGVPQAKK